MRLISPSRNAGIAESTALNFVTKHLAGSGARIELVAVVAAKALAYRGVGIWQLRRGHLRCELGASQTGPEEKDDS